ncbi:MAG: hypothetical protein GXP25_05645 [Planctomycetes bacterium]|nr:hypothetical protein [Planctomycetota bacterium]
MRIRHWLIVLSVLVVPIVWASPSIVEQTSEDVWVVRDDAGNCVPGSNGMTHQLGPNYQAKKILDLSNVPEKVWKAAGTVRLSAFFCVRDYSWHDQKKANGLDEAIEIVINGKVHSYPTQEGLPGFKEKTSLSKSFRWHDFAIPKGEFVRGKNEIIFRKADTKDKKPDDYLYLGIDNSVEGGNSWVKFGKDTPWQQDKLTVPGGKGEYAIRLYIIKGDTSFAATWFPAQGRTEDRLGVIGYAGSHGEDTRMEWYSRKLDTMAPIAVEVETANDSPFELSWLYENGNPKTPPISCKGPKATVQMKLPIHVVPVGVRFDKTVPLNKVTLHASRNYHPVSGPVDIAPRIARPKGAPADRRPVCNVEEKKITLANRNLRCTFAINDGKLQLASLYNEIAAAEMVRNPEHSALFMIEVGGKRYAGSRDFVCDAVSKFLLSKGFVARLVSKETGLVAKLSVWIDDALRMRLVVVNRSDKPVDFKVAFPHFSGLAISEKPGDDYYFFPWGGGIISDAPAIIRRGYGDHEALYQVMDIFSPAHGAGLLVRCTDHDGRHKILALRKHVPGKAEFNGEKLYLRTADEYKWTNSLPKIEGIGLTYEYLRRTRKPGGSFKLKDVAIEAHAGDWHAAMKRYADWCHKVWKFRPYPSRLTRLVHVIAAGWGTGYLFRNGEYKTNTIKPMTDCIELMSWWEWSPLGPWSTPFDRLGEVMSKASIKRWKGYFVKDPVTGQTMWNNQPGDYDGYNPRFGGLPAFRKAIQTYKDLGAVVTLYTDPFRMDDASKIGRKHGREWGVVLPNGKHSRAYEVWNPCHDCPAVRKWVAQTMKRVMRETGADGIRLDEYGHRGWACFSTLHKHTYAEPGCTEWQRAVAETTKMVHQAMDSVNPKSILTTEHPGYDYLMQYLDGCITYDLTVQATPLRPLECNTQRFYFPECWPGELDHRKADPEGKKRFWNAVSSFGRYYPLKMYNILRENNDTLTSRDSEPLIPTLAKYIYANHFAGGGKTITMLYNATGTAFEGRAVEVQLGEGEHLFDLLNCREAKIENGAACIFLLRDDVLCLAQLPDKLSAKRTGDRLEVTVAAGGKDGLLCVCDADGQALLSRPAQDGINGFDLRQIAQAGAMPACIKLLRKGLLVDAEAMPPEKGPGGVKH